MLITKVLNQYRDGWGRAEGVTSVAECLIELVGRDRDSWDRERMSERTCAALMYSACSMGLSLFP